MIHISELSWSRVSYPGMVVQPGSVVNCKVISIDRTDSKIGLSLKQMEADPLMETLESVLPAGEQPEFSEVPCDIPPSIEDICSALKAEKGIEAVNLGRCAREKRTVSQVGRLPGKRHTRVVQKLPILNCLEQIAWSCLMHVGTCFAAGILHSNHVVYSGGSKRILKGAEALTKPTADFLCPYTWEGCNILGRP